MVGSERDCDVHRVFGLDPEAGVSTESRPHMRRSGHDQQWDQDTESGPHSPGARTLSAVCAP